MNIGRLNTRNIISPNRTIFQCGMFIYRYDNSDQHTRNNWIKCMVQGNPNRLVRLNNAVLSNNTFKRTPIFTNHHISDRARQELNPKPKEKKLPTCHAGIQNVYNIVASWVNLLYLSSKDARASFLADPIYFGLKWLVKVSQNNITVIWTKSINNRVGTKYLLSHMILLCRYTRLDYIIPVENIELLNNVIYSCVITRLNRLWTCSRAGQRDTLIFWPRNQNISILGWYIPEERNCCKHWCFKADLHYANNLIEWRII